MSTLFQSSHLPSEETPARVFWSAIQRGALALTAVALVGALSTPAFPSTSGDPQIETHRQGLSHPLDDTTLVHNGDDTCTTADTPDETLTIGNGSMAAMLFRNFSLPSGSVVTRAVLEVTAGESSNLGGAIVTYAGPRAPAGELTATTAAGCDGTSPYTDTQNWTLAPISSSPGLVQALDITSLLVALRASDDWLPGMDLAISMRTVEPEDLVLEIVASEGGAEVEMVVDYYVVPIENALSGFGSEATGNVEGPLPEPQESDWYNIWTLNVHRITVFEDGDAVGRGDIFVMANPWATFGDSRGEGVFCWPQDLTNAPVRIALRDLGQPPGWFTIPCDPDQVWHIGNNETHAFTPPLSTTPFLLSSGSIEDQHWADCPPPGSFYVGEEDIELSLLGPHLHLDHVWWRSGAENVAVVTDPDRCRLWPGERAVSTGVSGRVEIEYSFDLERFETVDAPWGVYLIDYEGLSSPIDWTLGWFPDDVSTETGVEASGLIDPEYPSHVVSTIAPGARCIPVGLRTAGVVAAGPCLEPGTYSATHGDITQVEPTDPHPGEPHVSFQIVRFGVGQDVPSCLRCSPIIPPWASGTLVGLSAVAAAGLYRKKAVYARVGASLFVMIAITTAGYLGWSSMRSTTPEPVSALVEKEFNDSTASADPALFSRSAVPPDGDDLTVSQDVLTAPDDGVPGSSIPHGSTTTTEPPSFTTTTAQEKTTSSTTSTTTTVVSTTTSTTSSTTTQPVDSKGPQVKSIAADPNAMYTGDTSTITAQITDPSGVATATVYYRNGKSTFQIWGEMGVNRAGLHAVEFGPFGSIGSYEYRLLATDTLGNPNCSTKDLATCPGGVVEVGIP